MLTSEFLKRSGICSIDVAKRLPQSGAGGEILGASSHAGVAICPGSQQI